MRTIHQSCLVLALYCMLLSGCQPEKPAEQPDGPDFAAMGGLNIPRGLTMNTAEATPGYVLFNPLSSDTTFLINMDGEVVHIWDSDYGPSGGMYLKDNGNLLRTGYDYDAPVFGGGGQGGWFQEFTWDGELVWEYNFANEQHRPHHDIALLPNGNILAIAWEAKSYEEALQAGRDPAKTPAAGLWPDMIVELRPTGTNGAEVVWEWHMWDHLVQDFDPEKDNYGDPATHPELMDINLGRPLPPPTTEEAIDSQRAMGMVVTNATPENRGSDLFHMNAINYHPGLDQITFSLPGKGEIYIIDHGTTSEEAAGHRGGRWGKGGDFLYRWGNPQNYRQGDSTHQQLGGQHDVQWIPEGFPGAGHLLVFNNEVPRATPPYSAVVEIAPPLRESGYNLGPEGRFGPSRPAWEYVALDTVSFFAPFISGAHRMANGHTFVTEGTRGRYLEVTPERQVVWEYLTPYPGSLRFPDGTTPQPVGPLKYATFRATHIPMDHPAVAGKDLRPLDPQPPAPGPG